MSEEAAACADPLDALLKQIVGGWFLLTDGQGIVSKWSEPAELLFGRAAPDALGHSFFDTLLSGALGADAEQWRRFLAAGDPPQGRAVVELQGRHEPTGQTFPVQAVFIPVKLDEGFDFSLFLEDLAFELPMNLMLLRMRQQHPVVVRSLRAALEPTVWDGWRTAGTMVAFRPLGPTPWVEEELRRREEERAAAEAELEETLTTTDPGVQGEFGDLDDAAAIVARLLSAMERIEDLERTAARLPAEVEEAKREAQAGQARAEAAEREAIRARSELTLVQHAAAGAGPDPELLARLERLETELIARLQAELDALRGSTVAPAALEALAARLDDLDARPALEALERRLDAVPPAPDLDGLRDDVASLRDRAGELEALRDDVASLRDRAGELDALRDDVSGLRDRAGELEGLRADLASLRETAADQVARGELDDLRGALEALAEGAVGRTDLEAVRAQLATLADGWAATGDLDALRHALDSLADRVPGREELDGLRHELRDALAAAVRRDEVDALRGEIAHARDSAAAADDLAALRDEVAASGAAAAHDLVALRDQVAALRSDADNGTDALHERLDALSARLEDAVVARDREAVGLDAAAEELRAAVERAALEAAEARRAAAEAGDRIGAVEGGAGAVLDEVRAATERLEALSADAADQRGRLARLDERAAEEAGRRSDDRVHLDALRDDVTRLDGQRHEIDALRDDVARLAGEREGVAALREQLAELGVTAGRAADGVEQLRAEVAALREETAAARAQAELANAVAERAKADGARLEPDLRQLAATVDELKGGEAARRDSDGQGDNVNAVFREILGLAASRTGAGAGTGAGARPQPVARPAEPAPAPQAREPRAGFDDVSQPQATLGLDGRFTELNPSFARLVGYQEHEFGKATWPSPHDRQHYAQQQQQLGELACGGLDRVAVQSTYMHGQGLMVPVIGEIALVRKQDGTPSHLLLRAEERERAG